MRSAGKRLDRHYATQPGLSIIGQILGGEGHVMAAGGLMIATGSSLVCIFGSGAAKWRKESPGELTGISMTGREA